MHPQFIVPLAGPYAGPAFVNAPRVVQAFDLIPAGQAAPPATAPPLAGDAAAVSAVLVAGLLGLALGAWGGYRLVYRWLEKA